MDSERIGLSWFLVLGLLTVLGDNISLNIKPYTREREEIKKE